MALLLASTDGIVRFWHRSPVGAPDPADAMKAEDPLDLDWSGPLLAVVATVWRAGAALGRRLAGVRRPPQDTRA